MKKLLITVTACLSILCCRAQGNEPVSTFANLKSLKVLESITVFHPATGVEIINKACRLLPAGDPYRQTGDTPDGDDILVLRMKLETAGTKTYSVLYTNGPSEDPAFMFGDEEGQIIATLGGTSLYLPGNGSVYTSGHTNTSFNKRSKFRLKNGNFEEVPQAYYYVGLKTKTAKDITLYADREETQAVAVVPAGTEVEVLLAEFRDSDGGYERFLIRSPFGLVGWFGITTYNLGEPPVLPGIYYAGD